MNLKVIVVTGPESTGKSTLCQQLAEHFHSEYIAEYARDYVAERDYKYTYEDVEHIARHQHEHLKKRIEQIKNTPSSTDEPYLLFVDTHLIITKVWFEKVYGREPEWIAEAIAQLDEKFAGEGRVLIRPSGTESLVRVMIEGKNQAMIEEDAKNLADLIMRVML